MKKNLVTDFFRRILSTSSEHFFYGTSPGRWMSEVLRTRDNVYKPLTEMQITVVHRT